MSTCCTLHIVVDGARWYQYECALARTQEEIQRGFMYYLDPILPREGMLFEFPYAKHWRFWMANTPNRLKLAFIGPSGIVSDIQYGEPMSREWMSGRGEPYRYVLEVSELDDVVAVGTRMVILQGKKKTDE